MSKAHPYPLPVHALDDFTHPADWHLFRHARRHADEILAGNGYAALRATRGRWLDGEFPPATCEFLGRFGKLPWGKFPTGRDEEWRMMDYRRGDLFRSAQIGLWRDGKLTPSPVWSCNEKRVRLSLLQLVANLPRAEVFVGAQDRDDPLWFRFSGGIAAIAMDARLTISSGEIWGPARDQWSGERLRSQGRPKFQGSPSKINWPPVDRTDEESGATISLD